jgi:hypothetical protein
MLAAKEWPALAIKLVLTQVATRVDEQKKEEEILPT